MKKFTVIMLTFMLALSCVALTACETTPEPVSILSGWQDGDDEVYTVSAVSGKTQLVYDCGTLEYPFAGRTLAENEKLGEMKTLVFTAKASVTSGTYTAMLKLEGSEGMLPEGASPEVWFYLSEAYVTYEWDLSALDLTKAIRLLLFMNPAAVGGSGKILIKEAKFVADAADPDLAPATPVYTAETVAANVYTSGDELIVKNFGDNGDGVYAITNSNNGADINYNKTDSRNSWASFKAVVKGADLKNMKALEVKIQSMKGTEIIIKPYNQVEKRHTFTGGEDIVKVDLRSVNQNIDFTGEIPIIFMAEPQKVAVAGRVNLIGAKLTKEELPATYNGFEKFDALQAVAADTVAAKTLYAILDLDSKSVKTLVITAKGAADDTLTIKLGDADAALTALPLITLTSANAETKKLDVSGVSFTKGKLAKITIVYSGNKPDISTLYFLPVAVAAPTGTGGSVIAANMFTNVSAEPRYTFDYSVSGKVSATYTITAPNWDSMRTYVDFGEGGWEITLKIKGRIGASAIVKVMNQYEKETVLTGDEQTVTFSGENLTAIKGLKGIQEIQIFVDWDFTGTSDTLTITQFTFTKAA